MMTSRDTLRRYCGDLSELGEGEMSETRRNALLEHVRANLHALVSDLESAESDEARQILQALSALGGTDRSPVARDVARLSSLALSWVTVGSGPRYGARKTPVSSMSSQSVHPHVEEVPQSQSQSQVSLRVENDAMLLNLVRGLQAEQVSERDCASLVRQSVIPLLQGCESPKASNDLREAMSILMDRLAFVPAARKVLLCGILEVDEDHTSLLRDVLRGIFNPPSVEGLRLLVECALALPLASSHCNAQAVACAMKDVFASKFKELNTADFSRLAEWLWRASNLDMSHVNSSLEFAAVVRQVLSCLASSDPSSLPPDTLSYLQKVSEKNTTALRSKLQALCNRAPS